MHDMQVFAQEVFASQPFSRFIGAELTASGPDSAELTLAIQDHHKQQHGFVHGGVISYLADNAITFAGGLALGGNAASDDAAEVGYYAAREAMSRMVSDATTHLARHGLHKEGAPVLVGLVKAIAERYSIQVSEKAAAQWMPVLGALGGATVNSVFMDHFQSMARGHFIVRRLEAVHGQDTVRRAYQALARLLAE